MRGDTVKAGREEIAASRSSAIQHRTTSATVQRHKLFELINIAFGYFDSSTQQAQFNRALKLQISSLMRVEEETV